jgi:uncharacterized protein (TIGR03437 family)
VVTFYGTSFGGTEPDVVPGDFPTGISPVMAPVKVTIGGRDLRAEKILYAGLTPYNPGLHQLNVILPDDLPDGDLDVVLTIGTESTPPGAYLTVQK